MRATETEQSESGSRKIGVKRYIGGYRRSVIAVGKVIACRNQTDAELGVGSIVRPAYKTDIKPLAVIRLI